MIFPDEKNSPVFRKVPTANMVEAQITAWQLTREFSAIARHAQTRVF